VRESEGSFDKGNLGNTSELGSCLGAAACSGFMS